jgi:hypothetical protein
MWDFISSKNIELNIFLDKQLGAFLNKKNIEFIEI